INKVTGIITIIRIPSLQYHRIPGPAGIVQVVGIMQVLFAEQIRLTIPTQHPAEVFSIITTCQADPFPVSIKQIINIPLLYDVGSLHATGRLADRRVGSPLYALWLP